MIRIKLREALASEVLRRAGYELHKLGYFQGGYIKYLKDKGRAERRFHLKLVDLDTWELHTDITINGFHRLDRKAESIERSERAYFRSIQKQVSYQEHQRRVMELKKRPPKPKPIADEIVPNVREVQKRHVKIRSMFNPFRYLIGKFYE